MSTRSSEPTQDPHLWPASRRLEIVQDLAQGADTMAGLAHRYGLPVGTILKWQEQCPRPGDNFSARPGGTEDNLLMQGAQPLQARMTGLS
jgi:transposase-like protein